MDDNEELKIIYLYSFYLNNIKVERNEMMFVIR